MGCYLTHWGRVTHICVSKLTIIGSDNGLSPGQRQAIIWTKAGILLIGLLGTNFIEILTGIQKVSFKKMHLKMSSAKWHPFCPGLNVLNVHSLLGVPCLSLQYYIPWHVISYHIVIELGYISCRRYNNMEKIYVLMTYDSRASAQLLQYWFHVVKSWHTSTQTLVFYFGNGGIFYVNILTFKGPSDAYMCLKAKHHWFRKRFVAWLPNINFKLYVKLQWQPLYRNWKYHWIVAPCYISTFNNQIVSKCHLFS